MTIDYEEMEKGDFLQKLSDARYVIEHLGGYDIFINYYISILSKIVVIISSFFMIIKMCFTKSINHDIGRFSIISNSYILLSIILSFMLLNIFLSRLISKKSKMRTAEGYQNKMKVERRLNYYVDKVFSNVNFGKDIRIFQMQDYILSLYEDTLNASISFYNKFYHETIKNKESLNKIIMFIAQLSAYTLIIFKVYFKSISIGTMSRYIGVLYMFNNSINELIDINQKFHFNLVL